MPFDAPVTSATFPSNVTCMAGKLLPGVAAVTGRLVFVVLLEGGEDHPQAADAATLDLFGDELPAVVFDRVASLGHLAERVEEEAADRVPVVVGDAGVEQVVEIGDRHA